MFSLPIWWLLDLMFLVSTHDEVIFIVLLLLGTDLYVRELGMADVLMLQLVHRVGTIKEPDLELVRALLVYMSISLSYSHFLLKWSWHCMQSSMAYWLLYVFNKTLSIC